MTPSRWTAAEQSASVWRVGGGAGRNEFVLYGDDAGTRAMAKADELNARRDERLASMVPTRSGYYWATLVSRPTEPPTVVHVYDWGEGLLTVWETGADYDQHLEDFTFLSGPLEPPASPG